MAKVQNFERVPEADAAGGYKFSDPAAIAEQRGVVWDMLKQVASNVTEAKNLVNVSLPVRIFEARSYLERITDSWCYAPVFLSKAAAEKDPVERMKLVITFALAGLHNTCKQKKPFNPILGETFQAVLEDGTKVYCEQASHHPPVTAWQVFGPNDSYHFYGYGEWSASFSVNSVTGHQKGPHILHFKDGSQITYTLPQVILRGILWGDRVMDYSGTIYFRDVKNNLCAKVVVPIPSESSALSNWWYGNQNPPTDHFRGELYRYKMDGTNEVKGEVLAPIAGTWLGRVEIGGKTYWSIKNNLRIYAPIPDEHPLPSDCRFREDLVHLKKGDMEAAHDWKSKLENKQRRDAKLRREARGSAH
jgi:hypothetical protein